MKTRKIALLGMLIALAFVFSYIESLIPIRIGIPGAKLGLANLVVIIALYLLGEKEAFLLSIIRIILVGFTFSNTTMMLYSLAGGILSFCVMYIAKRSKKLSMTGVSVVGGVFHNVGQILVAMWAVNTTSLIYYFPLLMITGVVAGVVIGILGGIIAKHLKKMI